MNIHEYQAKEILKEFGAPVSNGFVIFNPEEVADLATFNEPLQFAKGLEMVIVNGEIVLENGSHTGKFPGRFVKGIGKDL